ncbi:hypothetical protein MUK42_21954 [Musa troglodytarum]|uniref:Uncharacterized protein n=1 Tax=Musa troglodytarum TaxID=320322 RepID=A0A9E7I8U7_9LILI|nr:hypothetical protein MUK42_21954 [Musa troglodytarum]
MEFTRAAVIQVIRPQKVKTVRAIEKISAFNKTKPTVTADVEPCNEEFKWAEDEEDEEDEKKNGEDNEKLHEEKGRSLRLNCGCDGSNFEHAAAATSEESQSLLERRRCDAPTVRSIVHCIWRLDWGLHEGGLISIVEQVWAEEDCEGKSMPATKRLIVFTMLHNNSPHPVHPL